jgi:L-ascorbate metabolism protein UlaG (beta-lactamase superfamily)
MDITWYGHSCFRITERSVATIIADPFGPDIGYGELSVKGDIVTVSHDAPGHNAVEAVKKLKYVLDRPGEYEIGGVFINGIATWDPNGGDRVRRNIIWVYQFEDFTVCHLGDLAHVPSQAEIEELGPIDVLLVPVGGGKALNSGQAGEVISLIEPSVVVPMHYQTPVSAVPLEPLDHFLKEMGVSSVEELDNLRVNASSLAEETQVVVLRPQS